MARRVPVLVLVSLAAAFAVRDDARGVEPDLPPAGLSAASAPAGDDGVGLGECECDPGSGDQPGRRSPVEVSEAPTVAVRGGPGYARERPPGTVLSSLVASMIVGRPPPAVRARP